METKQRKVSETKPQYAIFDFIVDLPVIRILKPLYEWNRGFWIYCFLGFLSVVTDFVVQILCDKVLIFFIRFIQCHFVAIPSASISNVIAWIVSTLASFVMFRYLYFDRTDKSFFYEFTKFVPTRLFTLGVGTLAIFVFCDIMKLNTLAIKAILIPVTAILNYMTSKIFVFKK